MQNQVRVHFHRVCVLYLKDVFVAFCLRGSFHLYFYAGPNILHPLPSQTIFDFLLQRHNKLGHFISNIMDIFWLVMSHR